MAMANLTANLTAKAIKIVGKINVQQPPVAEAVEDTIDPPIIDRITNPRIIDLIMPVLLPIPTNEPIRILKSL